MRDANFFGVSLLLSVVSILVFASLWAFAGVRAHAQVPPFVAYPVASGCLYVSAQGYMVLDQRNSGCR